MSLLPTERQRLFAAAGIAAALRRILGAGVPDAQIQAMANSLRPRKGIPDGAPCRPSRARRSGRFLHPTAGYRLEGDAESGGDSVALKRKDDLCNVQYNDGNMLKLIVAITFLVAGVLPMKAMTSVKQYKADMMSSGEAKNYTRIYVYGLGEAFEIANVAGKTPTFCAPPKLPLGMDLFLDILDRQIKEKATTMTEEELDNTQIGFLLLKGLQETFPCNAK